MMIVKYESDNHATLYKSERDARRYRWLVDHAESIVTGPFNWHWQDEHRPHPPMRTLDQCIDEASAKATQD
jgi:hypothetical protein